MAVKAPDNGGDRRSRFAPWAGLAAGMLAALAQHQGVGDTLHFRCGIDAEALDIGVGIGAWCLIAAGAWISWRALADSDDAPARAFASRLSLMAAGLFAVMVAWQTVAGLIEPACRP